MLEDLEVIGSRSAGLVIGEENGAPAHAEIRHCRFQRNPAGIGVFARSTATLTEIECRENQDGIIVLDQDSRIEASKLALFSNRDCGLFVHRRKRKCVKQNFATTAAARLAACAENPPSAVRWLSKTVALVGTKFGAGAGPQSTLILTRCVFDGTDKTNISKERSSTVQLPSGDAHAQPCIDAGKQSRGLANGGESTEA